MNHYFTNNEDLKSEIRTIEYDYQEHHLTFFSDNGVFSKDKIDYGSKVLVETFLKEKKKIESLLDMGCGYGYIGITLAKILQITPDMCDINKRAIHLASKNVKQNNVSANIFESNAYENVINKYDVIITNPPIRVGKDILLDILISAKRHLNENGELWFVIRKDQGAKSVMKCLESVYKCEVKEKSKGFYVIKAKIC